MNDMNKEENVNKKEDIEQIKAAYALNLCTVSVSQIVDYNDLNILEQEYELILNNLNLHNMPKDQALLHVLKQILDTVSFFRIAEGDKALIEKKYQQKVQNAIWNAIPSFGLIAVGDPYTFAISMLASVGMGYMNYRKEKAKTSLEREEQEWQLQRTAIEQFNALRRELFDTAWRLADTYNFPDNYRLTESQITQYNNILMDSNILRKFERLEYIKDNFGAYPPFWYYIANAARDVADMYKSEAPCDDTLYAITNYTEKAKEYYKKYLDCDIDLLRVNYTRSAACLEYVALLVDEKDAKNESDEHSKKLIELVDDAVKHCGTKMDVLQIAAIYYMKLEKVEEAEKILRKLVIEDYNAKINSQLLSHLYLQQSVIDKNKFLGYTTKYKELIQYVDRTNLIPWVESEENLTEDSLKRKNQEFLIKQINGLDYEFELVVNAVVAREAIAYNKSLYGHYMDYDDSFFDDSEYALKKRMEELSKIKGNDEKWQGFVSDLSSGKIVITLDDHINRLLKRINLLCRTTFNVDGFTAITEVDYSKLFETEHITKIKNWQDAIDKIDSKAEFTDEDCKQLIELTFTKIVSKIVEKYELHFVNVIERKDDYKELAPIESSLEEFCRNENLPSLDKLSSSRHNGINIIEEDKLFPFLSLIKGGDKMKKRIEEEAKILEVLKDVEVNNKLFERNQEGFNFTTDDSVINDRIKMIPTPQDVTDINNKGRILAYFHDEKAWYERYVDMFFMRTGIFLIQDAKVARSSLDFYKYDSIEVDRDKNRLYVVNNKREIYDSKMLKFDKLYSLISDIKDIIKETCQEQTDEKKEESNKVPSKPLDLIFKKKK